MKKIVLPQGVRLFKRTGPNSALLAQAGLSAEAGVEIEVGPVETMTYDHIDQAVVSFKCPKCPETHYILVTESGLSSLLN